MRRMKTGLIFAGILLFISCQNDLSTIPGSTSSFSVTVSSIECTETWLTLSVNQPDNKTIYTVLRDTHTVFSGVMRQSDTLSHDNGLEPASDIFYNVIQNTDGFYTGETTLIINTIDTTSQNFEIKQFTFGDGYIRDVAIIDEYNIWAVGRFYLDDSLYSALHWNGNKRKLFSNKTKVETCRLPSDLDAVIAINVNNVFLFSGPEIIHWNGSVLLKLYI